MKTVAVVAGAAAAVTSLTVGAWAATGDSGPAPKREAVAAPGRGVNAAAAPAGAAAPAVQPKTAKPTGLVKPGQVLRVGVWFRSPNRKYGLVQQPDGNLVLYQGKKA